MSGLHSPTLKTTESNTICLTKDQFSRLILAARPKRRSFTSTTINYDGTHDLDKAEEFLTCISLFKSFENISDDDALMTLPLVLKKDAAIWWSVIKNDVSTWTEFETRFRQTFAPIKPPYVIYQEIFANHQSVDEMTEMFIIKKRALFSKMPAQQHTETQQIDMIYGLLNLNIRETIPRDSVNSFEELINAARRVEEDLMLDRLEQTTANSRVRCNYCRIYGHTIELCRKRRKARNQNGVGRTSHNASDTESTVDLTVQVPSSFSCYGCGAPGVIRSNCSTCALTTREIAFSAINVTTLKPDCIAPDSPPIKLPDTNENMF